jgi:hypothetical protein
MGAGAKFSTRSEFIIKATYKHGELYDYSQVIYKDSKSKVIIICPNGNKFNQTPNSHLAGKGCPCPYCCSTSTSTLFTSEKREIFIQAARLGIHGNRYDYSLVDYVGVHTKVSIKCPKGHIFKQTPAHHLNGRGCPKCFHITLKDGFVCRSQLEALTYLKLKAKKVDFLYEERYPTACDGSNLGNSLYDFYIPSSNTYIEVTTYNKRVPYFKSYIKKILRKKRFVEDKLSANFKFIQLSEISAAGKTLINRNMDNSKLPYNLKTVKICTNCKIEKGTCEFYPRRDRTNGFRPMCKDCCSQTRKKT